MNPLEQAEALRKAFGLPERPIRPTVPIHPEVQRLGEYMGVLQPLPPPPHASHPDVIQARANATKNVTDAGAKPEDHAAFIDAVAESTRAKIEAASKVTK